MDSDILLINQLSQIAAALIAGSAGGMAFDLYQRLFYAKGKKRLKPSAYLKGDALFTIVLLISLLLFWFTLTNGSLRWSIFLWLALGAAIYLGLFRYRLEQLFAKIKLPHKPKREAAEEQQPKPRLKERLPHPDLINKGAVLLVKGYQQSHVLRQKQKALQTGLIKTIKSRLEKFFPKKEKKEEDL